MKFLLLMFFHTCISSRFLLKKGFAYLIASPIFAALTHSPAQVAKLVDALCSGRSVRKDVLVRIQSWALKHPVKKCYH